MHIRSHPTTSKCPMHMKRKLFTRRFVDKKLCQRLLLDNSNPRATGFCKNLRAGTPSGAVRPILNGQGVHGRVAEHLHGEGVRRSWSANSCNPTSH